MKHSLRTKLSFVIAIVVLLTVSLISFLSNLLVEKQFNHYIARQQEQRIEEIVSSLSQQYQSKTDSWNIEFIHTIGMYALYDGYILKVYDNQDESIWDAQAHDMSLCSQIMEDISQRMEEEFHEIHGKFSEKTYELTLDNTTIGSVSISYFGPFFFSENDFEFLNSLNRVLFVIGVVSFIFSILIGFFMAKELSTPILKTVDATKQISDGNYGIRIQEKTNTKEMDLLIESINSLAGSLEKQEKLRKKLTEDVSHELRTPIAILQSHFEAMIEGLWEPTIERLEGCNDEVKRIGILVSEIEKLTKIESENIQLKKSEINLHELINKVIQGFEVTINNRNLHVSVLGNDIILTADYDKINQIVVNLLSNAIKYTNDGGTITLDIQETTDTILLHVRDNGIGIPENELPYIFERFYRADKSRNRKTGGSGLGLAIVKSIVEAHGGKVSVTSELNKGSCFEVALPK